MRWTAIILTDEYAVRAPHYLRKLPKLQDTRYMSLIENISSSLNYFGESIYVAKGPFSPPA